MAKKTKKTKTTSDVKTFKVLDSNFFKKGDAYEFKLRSPAVIMANKIKTFFKDFKDISVQFDEENSIVYVYSTDYDKSDALNRFLIHKHDFGGIKLEVKVVDVVNGTAEILNPPSYTITDDAMVNAFKCIFAKSPMQPDFTQAVDPAGAKWNFFEFPSYAVVYQADSLLNIRGYDATLIADVVKEIFNILPGYQISTYTYTEA